MNEPYYDLNDDWSLVVSSFQTQYGIRLSSDLPSMGWYEFSYLLQGLSGDTPLGRIIAVRAENRPEVIREMGANEKRIRNEYRKRLALKKTEAETDNALNNMKQAFIRLAQ